MAFKHRINDCRACGAKAYDCAGHIQLRESGYGKHDDGSSTALPLTDPRIQATPGFDLGKGRRR